MNNIDNIVDKALDTSRKTLEEPKHVLVHRWFKTWKMFKYETPSQNTAYDKFNSVMEQLSQHIREHHGFFIDYKNTILYGTCAACAAKEGRA